jgi:hypothetical protein
MVRPNAQHNRLGKAGKLSDSINANTYTKITFNLGNGKDILDISACMMLEIEDCQDGVRYKYRKTMKNFSSGDQ